MVSVEEQIEVFRDGREPERRQAVAAVIGLGRSAVPVLLAALQDDFVYVRVCAAQALAAIPDPQAVGPLCDALEDASPAVRWECATALVRLQAPESVPALCRSLEDAHWEVSLRAAEALERIFLVPQPPSQNASPLLAHRRALLPAVVPPEASAAVLPLCHALGREEAQVRRTAARVLAAIASPDAVPALCAALADPEPDVRVLAGQGLARLADRRAVEALCGALRDREERVRIAAAEALTRVAQEQPTRTLTLALPQLRRLSSPWLTDSRNVYASARAAIEAVTMHLRDLPLPAEYVEPPADNLPLPAVAAESLSPGEAPLPAPGPAPVSVASDTVSPPSRLPWWAGALWPFLTGP